MDSLYNRSLKKHSVIHRTIFVFFEFAVDETFLLTIVIHYHSKIFTQRVSALFTNSLMKTKKQPALDIPQRSLMKFQYENALDTIEISSFPVRYE